MFPFLFIKFFLSKLIETEEQETYNNKGNRKDTDPHKHATNTLRIKIYKEVRVDKGCGCGRNQNRRVKLQDDCLDKQENYVSKRERNGSNRIIPLSFFALVEQKPVCYVHNGKHNMEAQATNSPVGLRIAAFCACEHNVKHEEGKQNAKHSDKLQNRSSRNKAVFFFLCSLNQSGEHNTDAKEITDVCEVNIEIPANRVNVVEDSKACYKTYDQA